MVELSGVSYVANDKRIVDGISTVIPDRKFTVVLGPNGAGKSTVLKLATGLLRPTAGSVRYGDQEIGDLRLEQLARQRAVLSQHVDLTFTLPAEDVVLMGRYPYYGRVPSPRDREIVRQALAIVGMSDRRRQPYPTLSGGEQQKVQLARVLAQIWNDEDSRLPRYLFLDEPTTNLDIHYEIHLLDVARGLLNADCTVVAILHDINVALHFGDHFLFLSGGRLAASVDATGVTQELLEAVFRVRAHRVHDVEAGEQLWRFAL